MGYLGSEFWKVFLGLYDFFLVETFMADEVPIV